MLNIALQINDIATDTNNGKDVTDDASTHTAEALWSMLLIGILMVAISISSLLSSRGWNRYLPESGASMLFGLVIGGALELLKMAQLKEDFFFKPEMFYFLILPPIIFEAGFSMKKRDFFLNMGSILLFAVLGTLISTIVIGYTMFGLAHFGVISGVDDKRPLEGLIFGALISATDPVATLSIMGSSGMNVKPLLYSIVFGESVLNDAVSIVLFHTFSSFLGSDSFESTELLKAIGKFCGISLGSVAIGVGIGLISAIFFKRSSYLKANPHLEVCGIILFAYLSYLVAELAEMSGIMSLFLTGITMKHYSWYSLSEEAQITSHHFSKTVTVVSETFLFVYLGINIAASFSSPVFKWDPMMLFISLLVILLGRACNVFPMSFLANIRRKQKIDFKMQVMIWFSGLRGAIAFALSVNVPTPHKPVILTTTLFIVLFTTLVQGCLTTPMFNFLGQRQLEAEPISEEAEVLLLNSLDDIHKDFLDHSDDEEERPVKKKKTLSIIHQKWRIIDEHVMKPLFGGKKRDDVE